MVFFFSFPRDPELRKTRSKLNVALSGREGDEGKHQFTKEDRGDVNLTADDQTAPGVVRRRQKPLWMTRLLLGS